MNQQLLQRIASTFQEKFGRTPKMVFRSPGRINLIGEHADYNDGFVLPAAIDKNMFFALSKNKSGKMNIYAFDLDESITIDFEEPEECKSWVSYFVGVSSLLKNKGLDSGFDCVFGGDIPLGAGLSSSAALTCGLAYGLNELFQLDLDKKEIALLAQKTEHQFIGVKCGIMDQMAVLLGASDACIKLDCRSLEIEKIPLKLGDYEVVLFDSNVKHSLASSEYNLRRADCERGVQIIKEQNPKVKSLRDVPLDLLKANQAKMSQQVYNRCLYVVEEIARTQAACEDLKSGNLTGLGTKMFETHSGLSSLYEVSCPELDFLVSCVSEFPEVIGARMMGGGFGGCTINLIHQNTVDDVIMKVKASFKQKFNSETTEYRMPLADGVNAITLDYASN